MNAGEDADVPPMRNASPPINTLNKLDCAETSGIAFIKSKAQKLRPCYIQGEYSEDAYSAVSVEYPSSSVSVFLLNEGRASLRVEETSIRSLWKSGEIGRNIFILVRWARELETMCIRSAIKKCKCRGSSLRT